MGKILMFHPTTLEQLFLDDGASNAIDQLKGHGFLENPPLVAMYHPNHQKHLIVRKEDQEIWEERGYYANPTIVYHPTEGTKMVPLEQATEMYTQGWYDNPAKFPGGQLGTMKLKPRKESEAA